MLRDDGFRRQALGDGISAEHFHRYRPVYDAIMEMAKEGVALDAATLSGRLEADGVIEDIGGTTVIADMWAETNDGKLWRHWVANLRKAHADRIRYDGMKLVELARTPEAAMQALEDARLAMKAALSGPSRSKSAKEVMLELAQEIERLAKAGPIPGIPTGIPELDALSGGMRDGQLWSILAQTSRGKSVLMQQLGYSSVRTGKFAAFFSAEMMALEVGARLVSHRGGIPLNVILNPGTATKGDIQQFRTQMRILAEELFSVDDTPRMSLAHVEREAERLANANNGLGVVVVDYIQILKAERRNNQNREEAVAAVSSGLKQLAKYLGCPVVTAAQVNKDGKTRESEAIAFDSDVMLGISDEGIKVMKLRNGKRDDLLHYRLDGPTQTFVRFTPEPVEEEQQAGYRRADQWSASQGWKKGKRDLQARG